MKQRALSIDALRGYAIVTMVLIATIVTTLLPGWMSHAQTPPPTHEFNPDLPGITWVDMVFPSFLFAMGAALPFSVGNRLKKGINRLKLSATALWRGLKLAYFAILIQHFYPYMLSAPQDVRSWLLAIFCFALLFPMFMRFPWKMPSWVRTAIQLGAMAVGALVMCNVKYADGATFSLYTSNIIILILSNVAVFATLLYIFTVDRPYWRIAALACIAGIFLSADACGTSWQSAILAYSPAPWLYNARWLKYLFVVMPGCYAGEILSGWYAVRKNDNESKPRTWVAPCLLAIVLVIIVSNLYFLYTRQLVLNLACTVALLAAGLAVLKPAQQAGYAALWRKLFVFGSFMLLLGLCWESYEGGVKKDPVTFSYLFITGGLAFMTLIFFSIICDYYDCRRATSFLVLPGQNPMMAYVACDLLIYPVLNITGLLSYFGIFTHSATGAFLQGVVLTSLAVIVTMFFTRLKCIWRT